MKSDGSYRQILRSTGIIGGASIINVLISLIRIKVAAILLGPAGIGLIGLYQSLISTAAIITGFGISNVGTRQIAQANKNQEVGAADDVRRALFLAALALSIVGGCVFWLFRDVIANHILQDKLLSDMIGWMGLGVAFTIAAGSQVAVLQGMRKTGDIARLSIFSALISTVISIAMLFSFGIKGIIFFILVIPAANFAVGFWYMSKLPRINSKVTPLGTLLTQWKTLIRMGIPFMLAGLIAVLAQLLMRTMVQREMGAEVLGNFQAAWQVSMTYIGIVLTAMGTDYYPRLTSIIKDRVSAEKMVNEQTEMALLLAGPLLIAMLALAPWIVDLLYSNAFGAAAEILRLHVLGDILKIVSWPLGYMLLATGDGRSYLATEAIGYGTLVIATAVLIPIIGVNATGAAFAMMYLTYLPCVYWIVKKRTGFTWSMAVKNRFFILLLSGITCSLLITYIPNVGSVLSFFLSICLACETLRRMHKLGLMKVIFNKLGN